MRHPVARRRSDASGFTLIELLVTVGIIGVVMLLTVPSLLRARISGNEVSAIASLRTINTAQSAYAGAAATGQYAPQLSVLTQPCPGASQGFLSSEFAADPSSKSGYSIDLDSDESPAGPPDCNGVVTRQGYYVAGVPISSGRTGLRSFATSQNGVIYFNPGGTPPTAGEIASGTAAPIQ
jgi:type IV pilus assembly protein PilA